jgi:hypothetical protein
LLEFFKGFTPGGMAFSLLGAVARLFERREDALPFGVPFASRGRP